ncbi:GTPase [Pseudomonas nitroreducens]|uniref:GTPase n=1 Tax=Pseudomonas nitroreducens TaxID=46680 RepID=UPI00382AB2E8
MTESLPLILEDNKGERRETHTARLAIRLEGRELWLEADGKGGLLIYADSHEDDAEIPLLVVRPQAVNQLGLSLELEAAEVHEHGPDCGCDHHH